MTNFEYIKKRICDKLTIDDLIADQKNDVIGIMFCNEIEKVRGKDCPLLIEECNSEKGCYKWLQQEYKKPILDDVEREYLSAVIKPFRDKVTNIYKLDFDYNEYKEYILINLEDDYINMPNFATGTMYKGMEAGKEYTLEELGL